MSPRVTTVLLSLLALLATVLLATRWLEKAPEGDEFPGHAAEAPPRSAGDAPQLRAEGRPRAPDPPHGEERPSVPAAAPLRRVRGRILDPSGRPTGRALAWWTRRVPDGHAARTGPAGRFVLSADHLEPGVHVLCARGPKTATATANVEVPASPGEVDMGDLMLPEGLRIRGRVADRLGRPLAFVRVRCWSEAEGATAETASGGARILVGGDDVVSNAEGEFVLRGLAPEPHRVFVDLTLVPGRRARPPQYTGVFPGGEPLTFMLDGRTLVGGVVIDAQTKRPVRRFKVGVRRIEHAEGRFLVPLEAGQALEIRARGYLDARRDDLGMREGEEVGNLRILLEPNRNVGTLVVRAVDLHGDPVTDWYVSGVGPDWRAWLESCHDASGVARVEGLVPGSHVFTVRGEGRTRARGKVEVVRLSEVEHRVVLERCGSLRLQVLAPDGSPWKHATLELLDQEGRRCPWTFVFTRPQGTAFVMTETSGTASPLSEVDGRVTGVRSGRYTLRVKHGETILSRVIDLPREGEIELVLRQDG